ncbi:MAG: hypothetical protein CMG64_06210 [Candidatus Marinimicrobia bacterium]|nr:hypothetical protein [Candidatus Neomarinimicrobiota bacterium]|tara:strand:- start:3194 stop:3610 length:417 start_codon:yes stop_codon:yes gene_type:complete
MTFEGLICPNCSGQLEEQEIKNNNLLCPHCGKNIRNKKYIAFLEYLIMAGLVTDIDFFDQSIYGDEIEKKSIEEKELEDYTNPQDYEDQSERMKNYDETADLKEVTTDESKFREWDGVDEDWEEFNSRDDKKEKTKNG